MKYKTIHRVIYIFLSIFLGVSHSNLQARIISVQGSNSSPQLSINANAQSQISWSVVEEENSIGQARIASTGGTFFTPKRETILGSNTVSLSQSRTLLRDMNTTFIFREFLTIPQTVIRKAQQLGHNQLIYVRSFTDNPGNTSLSNVVLFSISSSSADGKLNVRRVQMEFDDGRTSSITAPNAQIRARAILSYIGTGLIEYTWEIATPPSTQGKPMFTPFISQKQYLMSGGQVTIQTPFLPALREGRYLLRLRIDKPSLQLEMPLLNYTIYEGAAIDINKKILPMTVSSPQMNAQLAPETKFIWEPISEAKAYQVEIYARPVRNVRVVKSEQQKPLTGVLIPAAKTQLKIGNLSRTHLNNGNTYYWRVIALSKNGQVIATSEFRSINF